MKQIAGRLGVTKQRVSQLLRLARTRLAAGLGRAADERG